MQADPRDDRRKERVHLMPRVPHKRPHVSPKVIKSPHMKMSEVYARLPLLTRQTVLRLVKRGVIPGGEKLYTIPPRPGEKTWERWIVRRERFEAWDRLQHMEDIIKAAGADETGAADDTEGEDKSKTG